MSEEFLLGTIEQAVVGRYYQSGNIHHRPIDSEEEIHLITSSYAFRGTSPGFSTKVYNLDGSYKREGGIPLRNTPFFNHIPKDQLS